MTLIEGERECAGCGKPETDIILFDIIIPPLITERTFLCEPCLKVAIDASKKKKQKEP